MLDDERAAIVAEINVLRTKTIEDAPLVSAVRDEASGVHGRSPIEDKIALFRRLFPGAGMSFPFAGKTRNPDAAAIRRLAK